MTSSPHTPLDHVDDDRVQYGVYAKGRALSPGSAQRDFTRYLPPRRPLSVIDLGSYASRFTPALAEASRG